MYELAETSTLTHLFSLELGALLFPLILYLILVFEKGCIGVERSTPGREWGVGVKYLTYE